MTNKQNQRTVTCNSELWEEAKEKAGVIPMSKLIRILLKAFVNGEIIVTLGGNIKSGQ